MNIFTGIGRFVIFIGDIVLLYAALFISLLIRFPESFGPELILNHITPFSILFVLWIIVFMVSGLYEKHVGVLKNRLPGTILRAQIINCIIAVIFFYVLPLAIAPKTILFLYILISSILIVLWRVYGPLMFRNKSQAAFFIGSGDEFHELVDELTHFKGYPIQVAKVFDLSKLSGDDLMTEIKQAFSEHPMSTIIVLNIDDPRINNVLPMLYDLISLDYSYVDVHKLYEDVFKRLPVSLLNEKWFIKNVSFLPSKIYDVLKRVFDIILSLIALLITSPFYLLAYLLIKIEDGGPVFFSHERVGENNRLIKIVKFRSMPVHNESDGLSKERKITKVGSFLRMTHIDELPQLLSVIKGDQSLIGPRPELPALVAVYEKQVPYYGLRHYVKPGLSGWAQINQKIPPKFSAELDKTKIKVSYDLFYIKHRSFFLDIYIALKTVGELLSRRGV